MPLQGVTVIQLGRERKERSASEAQVQEKPRQLNAACFYTNTQKGCHSSPSSFLQSFVIFFVFFAFFFSLTPCWTVEMGTNKASPRQLRRLQQVGQDRCQTLSHIPRPQRAPTFSTTALQCLTHVSSHFTSSPERLHTKVVCHQVGTSGLLFK